MDGAEAGDLDWPVCFKCLRDKDEQTSRPVCFKYLLEMKKNKHVGGRGV